MKSLMLDKWKSEERSGIVNSGGNAASNAVYEARFAPGFSRPHPGDPMVLRAAYIKAKYVGKAFTKSGRGALMDLGKTGWLTRCDAGKTSSDRWVALRGKFLYMFKSAEDDFPSGIIPLERCSVLVLGDDGQFHIDGANEALAPSAASGAGSARGGGKSVPHSFTIFTPDKQYTVAAPDGEELAEWVMSIRAAKALLFENVYGRTDGGRESIIGSGANPLSAVPTKTGWMWKKGGGVKSSSWKKRLFILSEHFLYYYKSDSDTFPAGVINLADCSGAPEPSSDFTDRPNVIMLPTRSRRYYFAAETAGDVGAWISSLAKAVAVASQDSSVVSPVNRDANAVRTGWLTKQGGTIKSWKKRWFVLSANLFYYKSQEDLYPAGVIALERAIIRPLSALPGKPGLFRKAGGSDRKGREDVWCFSITTPSRTFYLQAPSEDVRADWIADLTAAVMAFNPEPVSSVSIANPDAAGLLYKLGDTAPGESASTEGGGGSSTSKVYKEKWAVLKGNALYLYRKEGDPVPTSTILLSNATLKMQPGSGPEGSQAGCFQIVTPDRILSMRAPDSDAYDVWVSALDRARARPSELRGVAVIREGPLYKQGGPLGRFWQKRWVALKEDRVVYKKNASDAHAAGEVLFDEVSSVAVVKDADASRPHAFGIITGSRNYFFAAESESDAEAWRSAIAPAIEACRKSLALASRSNTRSKPMPSRATGSGAGSTPVSSEVIQEGWLTKQGAVVKSWKRRWCVVTADTLYYYTNADDSTPKGKIYLGGFSLMPNPALGKDRAHTFAVMSAERRYFFSADSEADKIRWMRALERAKGKVQAEQAHQRAVANAAGSSAHGSGLTSRPASSRSGAGGSKRESRSSSKTSKTSKTSGGSRRASKRGSQRSKSKRGSQRGSLRGIFANPATLPSGGE